MHPDYSNCCKSGSSQFKTHGVNIEVIQGLLWSIGILIMKYIIDLNDDQIEKFKNNYIIGNSDLTDIKEINKIFLIFLNYLFDYQDIHFSEIYLM